MDNPDGYKSLQVQDQSQDESLLNLPGVNVYDASVLEKGRLP